MLRLLLFILPAYVANAAPVVLGGLWPIDQGLRLWDGRPIFGASKTWLGFFGGILAGLLTSILMAHALKGGPFDLWASQPDWYILCGALLAAGAMAGDLTGSFIKRRLGFKPGSPSYLLDQLTFLLGAIAAVSVMKVPFLFTPFSLLFLIIVTYAVHRGANALAHAWQLKRVPW